MIPTKPPRLLFWLALASMPVVLTGCLTRIDPAPAPVSLPEAFAISGEAPLPERWWLSFDDPRLNRLIEHALSKNFTLKTAWDRLEQAEASLRIARSELIPNVDAQAENEFAWQRVEVVEPDGEGGTDTTYDVIDTRSRFFGIFADYEVDLWGRIRSLRNAEALELSATGRDLQAAAITLTAQVASTWYQLQEQVGQLHLLEAQIETSQKTLQLIEGRFRLGQVPATDVLQQRQLVEARREALERVLANIRVLEVSLAILLGEAPGADVVDAEGELIALPPLPETGLPAELVSTRPDVQAAYRAFQAADQRVASAMANRYPRLTLTAGFSTTDEDWRGLFDTWLGTVAANLAAPVIDGGALRAEVRRSEAVAAERFHNYGQTLLEALGEVEQALAQEVQQRAVVESLEKQLEMARLVLERTRSRYLRGAEEYLRVLEAQLSVQVLERSLLLGQRELIGFRIDLCRALAGDWQLEPPTPDPVIVEDVDMIYPLPI